MLIRLSECKEGLIKTYNYQRVPSLMAQDRQGMSRQYVSQCVLETVANITLREQGYTPKRYYIGCGRCSTCAEEAVDRKRSMWFKRLLSLLTVFSTGYKRSVRGQDIEIKGETPYFMTVTVSNKDYPGLNYPATDSELSYLNQNSEAFREWSYQAFRHRLQTMHKYVRKHVGDYRYCSFVEFGGQNTCRIHVHTFIFAETRELALKVLKFYKEEYNSRYKTSSEHGVRWRAVDSEEMAAAYASKYSMKTLSHHRIMSSQFCFENAFALWSSMLYNIELTEMNHVTPHGYDSIRYQGGFTKWRVVVEGSPFSFSPETLPVQEMLERYVELSSVAADVELDNPTFNPLQGGFAKWQWKEGYNSIEMSKKLAELGPSCRVRLVPHSSPEVQRLFRTSPGLRELKRRKGEQFVSLCAKVIDPVRLCKVSELLFNS